MLREKTKSITLKASSVFSTKNRRIRISELIWYWYAFILQKRMWSYEDTCRAERRFMRNNTDRIILGDSDD